MAMPAITSAVPSSRLRVIGLADQDRGRGDAEQRRAQHAERARDRWQGSRDRDRRPGACRAGEGADVEEGDPEFALAEVEIALGLDDEGQRPQQHAGHRHLPRQHVERRAVPAMAAGMQDGDRPGEAGEQQPEMASTTARLDQSKRVGSIRTTMPPVPSATPSRARQPTRLADQQRQRHQPQHGGIGEHARAAGRHELQAEIGQGEVARELEDADRQHDRPVGALRPAQAASAANRRTPSAPTGWHGPPPATPACWPPARS